MENYIVIGHTKKTFGTLGEVKVDIKERFLDAFTEADFVFIEVQGKKVPFFIEELRYTNSLLLKVEEIDTPEEAHAITGKEVFLRQEDLLKEETTTSVQVEKYDHLLGYQLLDKNGIKLGKIKEIVEMPQQMMAAITFKGREILLPLNKTFITKTDHENKEVEMELPEGLLDL